MTTSPTSQEAYRDKSKGAEAVRPDKWTCDADGNWVQRPAPAQDVEWLSRNRENARSEK